MLTKYPEPASPSRLSAPISHIGTSSGQSAWSDTHAIAGLKILENHDVASKDQFFLTVRADPTRLQPSVPEYSFESLGLAVREASVAFQEVWEARLGYKRIEGISSASWQGIKAMSRRHAEGWFDSFWLRPVDTLISLTRNVLTRFLETPLTAC